MNLDPMISIRENYDRIADEYAAHLFTELHNKPQDQELLRRFASQVSGRGEVCDMGCGPGQVARYLHGAGVTVFGLDLSLGMLHQARKLNPGIPFREGNLLSLNLRDNTLAGITAFYAIVNIEDPLLPQVFREMQRVLQPGGLLLLSFHTGDQVDHVKEMWGKPVTLTFFLFHPQAIHRHLEAAGFAVEQIIERGPYAPEVEHQTHRAYIFARKPI